MFTRSTARVRKDLQRQRPQLGAESLEKRELLNGEWSPFETVCVEYEPHPFTGQPICIREENAPPPWQQGNPNGKGGGSPNQGMGYPEPGGELYPGANIYNPYPGSGTNYPDWEPNPWPSEPESKPDYCVPAPENNWCYVGLPHEPNYGPAEPQWEDHKGKKGKHGHKWKAQYEGNPAEPPGFSKKQKKKAKFENSALAWMMDTTHRTIDQVIQDEYVIPRSPAQDAYDRAVEEYIRKFDGFFESW